MRTDTLLAAPLAAALAAALAGAGLLAAQDALVLDPSPNAVAPAPAPVQRGGIIQLRGDRTIAAGEVVDGEIVVFDGSLTVAGEVRGGVAVTRGDLRLLEGALVGGDAVVTGGRLVNEGARVGGEMRADNGEAASGAASGTAATRVRLGRSPLALFGGGSGLAETLGIGLLLSLVGVGMIFYGGPQLSRLSDTIRGEGVRSAGIGVAALFLSLPAFILGAVALALTIILAPLIVVYAPLFWIAVVAAGIIGLVAVAHALGERTAEQRGVEGAAPGTMHSYLFTGLALLLAPLLVAQLLQMTGVLGFVGDLVSLAAWAALFLAACVGAGAVLLNLARVWREHRFRRMMGLGGAPEGDDAQPV